MNDELQEDLLNTISSLYKLVNTMERKNNRLRNRIKVLEKNIQEVEARCEKVNSSDR